MPVTAPQVVLTPVTAPQVVLTPVATPQVVLTPLPLPEAVVLRGPAPRTVALPGPARLGTARRGVGRAAVPAHALVPPLNAAPEPVVPPWGGTPWTVAAVAALSDAALRGVGVVARTPADACVVVGAVASSAAAIVLGAEAIVVPSDARRPVVPGTVVPGTVGPRTVGPGTVRAVLPAPVGATRTGAVGVGAAGAAGLSRSVSRVLRGTPASVVVVPERQVQGIGPLAWPARRVLRRRRAARPVRTVPVRTGRAPLAPCPSRAARRTTSGAWPSLRAGAASAAAGTLPPAA
ncbi:hypothetical protein [Nonomuraea turcica]|uniref:hypothetical protein n=1 Tax=Nonomuraea sp. G32 TaxID=3067274 RepID=UPI00273AD506|nr:hypothetical protein [Nonomuraea sp. G32]MDP4506409.1 hypothetical protein [Nonomuraea sp. G32]